MKTSVIDIFAEFSTLFEGYIPHMYLDIKGLVTVGIGNLIDPVNTALNLPFIRKVDGQPATRNDIIIEHRRMKLNKQLAQQGHRAAAKIATLELTKDGIANLVRSKMFEFEAYIKHHTLPEFDNFPADAQLGIMSMAWAMGPGFFGKFPSFTKACKAQEWSTAGEHCYINSKNNPGLVPRNKANKKLFLSAAYVQYENLNPEIIYGLQTSRENGANSPT